MARFEIPDGWTAQAYKFALDPTPAQVRAFRSHAGGARKAHNTMLALAKAVMNQRQAERTYGIAEDGLTPTLGWSLPGLRKEWNARKDLVAPWWAENSKEAYNSGWTLSLAASTRGRNPVKASGPGRRLGSLASSPPGPAGRCGSPPAPSESRRTGITSPCPGWGGSTPASPPGNWPDGSRRAPPASCPPR